MLDATCIQHYGVCGPLLVQSASMYIIFVTEDSRIQAMTVSIVCNRDTSTTERSSQMKEEGHETSLLCRERNRASMVSNRAVAGLELRHWHIGGGSGIDRRARARPRSHTSRLSVGRRIVWAGLERFGDQEAWTITSYVSQPQTR